MTTEDTVWTEQKVAQLINLRVKKKYTFGEIAREMGIPRSSVAGKLKRLADKNGSPTRKRRAPSSSSPWSPAAVEKMIRMRADNIDLRVVAAAVGVTYPALCGKISYMIRSGELDSRRDGGKEPQKQEPEAPSPSLPSLKPVSRSKLPGRKPKVDNHAFFANPANRETRKKVTVKIEPAGEACQFPPVKGVTEAILALPERGCHWPTGDGTGFHFCGAARPDPEKNAIPRIAPRYCAYHTALALAEQQPRGVNLSPKVMAS